MGLADENVDQREHQDSEQEVRGRSRGNDGHALPDVLVLEGDGAFGIAQWPGRFAFERAVTLAEHAHIAAERYPAELPARAGLVGPSEQLRPETDGEDLDPHIAPACDREMAK